METRERPSVLVEDGWMRVLFRDGEHADYHFRWLRHNCDQDRHPKTGERTICSSELPDKLEVSKAWIEQDQLCVAWKHDGRISKYAMAWVRQHAYALGRVAVPPPPNKLDAIELDSSKFSFGALLDRSLEVLEEHGLVIVRRAPGVSRPAEEETEPLIEALATRSLDIVGTHFGRIEDLRTDNTTNQNTDQLGYTDAPVDLHTDQPFLEHPPKYQLLQSIRAAEEGGESLLADARAAFRYYEAMEARAAELLRTVPMYFHRRQKEFERLVISPMISNPSDNDFLVRFSYFTIDPHRLPFAQMEEYYRAHDRFVRLVRDPKYHYRTLLKPGDWVLYNNHRMLHARTGFRGARWVRGIYFNPKK